MALSRVSADCRQRHGAIRQSLPPSVITAAHLLAYWAERLDLDPRTGGARVALSCMPDPRFFFPERTETKTEKSRKKGEKKFLKEIYERSFEADARLLESRQRTWPAEHPIFVFRKWFEVGAFTPLIQEPGGRRDHRH